MVQNIHHARQACHLATSIISLGRNSSAGRSSCSLPTLVRFPPKQNPGQPPAGAVPHQRHPAVPAQAQHESHGPERQRSASARVCGRQSNHEQRVRGAYSAARLAHLACRPDSTASVRFRYHSKLPPASTGSQSDRDVGTTSAGQRSRQASAHTRVPAGEGAAALLGPSPSGEHRQSSAAAQSPHTCVEAFVPQVGHQRGVLA